LREGKEGAHEKKRPIREVGRSRGKDERVPITGEMEGREYTESVMRGEKRITKKEVREFHCLTG